MIKKSDARQFWAKYREREGWAQPELFSAGSHPGCPTDPDEVFGAVVRLCDSSPNVEPQDDEPVIRFFAEGKVIKDCQKYLPKSEDKNFHGWYERMNTEFTDFALVLNRLEKYFNVKVRGIRDFITEMLEGMGYPTNSTDLTLFAGRYSKTPFGVHVDPEVNFYLPIVGPKTMRFWTPGYGEKVWKRSNLQQRKDYADHLPKAKTLLGKPGDMMAWSGDWWHIGEAADFNVSLTIPLYFHSQETFSWDAWRSKLLDDLIKISAVLSGKALVPKKQRADLSLVVPSFILEASELLSKVYTREELKEALIERWVTRVSTAGLKYKLSRIEKKGVFTPRPYYRAQRALHWTYINSNKICLACDGNSTFFKKTKGTLNVLKKLSTLETLSTNELQRCFGNFRGAKRQFERFLAELIQIGAVDFVEIEKPKSGERKTA